MATASEISVGVSHELAITATKVGFEPKDFATLAHSEDKMSAVLGFLRGTHEIRPIDHMIDLSIPCELPFTGAECVSPAKMGVVKLERRGNDLYLDSVKLDLFLSEKQKGGKVIGGHDLRKELEARGGNVGGNILDHLVAHPELWPENWKKDSQGNTVHVFFWADIFLHPSVGHLCVRYGFWSDGRVVSDCRWLSHGWLSRNPSTSLAS